MTKKWQKKDSTSEKKIINSNNSCTQNQNSQTHFNPFSGSFFTIDLTLGDPSFFTDYNGRVYKTPAAVTTTQQ